MPSKQPPAGAAPKSVREAFSSFEESLRAMLTAEAQRSVEQAIESLSAGGDTFRITEISIDVKIDELKVATGAGARTKPAAKPRARRRAATAKPSRTGRGRPVSALRSTLLGAFSSDDQELSTDDLRQHLQTEGITTTVDNLHQHLGRLVKAGELTRPGRGRYRRRP